LDEFGIPNPVLNLLASELAAQQPSVGVFP